MTTVALVENIKEVNLDYGDFISHKELHELAEIDDLNPRDYATTHALNEAIKRRQFELLKSVDALKDYLLTDNQMYLVSVHGQGYRIAEPKEQTFLAVQKARKGISSQLSQLERDLTHVNTNLLSQTEIAENAEAKAKTASLRMMVGKRRLLG